MSAKMSAICSDGPTLELFSDWIHANFLGNNRTKTITAEKYARICRYMLGDYTCTNAKFRYWVKSKGFHVVHTGVGRNYKGNELLIKYHPKRRDNGECVKKPTKCASRTMGLALNQSNLFEFRKVAVVEDFYDIIRAVHVDKYGSHVGQKQTYKIVSCIYAFLPREVVTFFLVNCDYCKPRIEKYGNGSRSEKLRSISVKLDFTAEDTACKVEPNPDEDDDVFVEEEKPPRNQCFIELDEEDLTDNEAPLNEDEDNLSVSESPEDQVMVKEEDKVPDSPPSTVVGAEENKTNFQNKVSAKSQNSKKDRVRPTGSGRRLSYSTETDEKLLHWVKKFQENRVNVTREMLQKQALTLIQPECPEFKASSGWVEKFLVRHGLTLPGMCRSLNNSVGEKAERLKQQEEQINNGPSIPVEPVIREPPNLNEILNNVNTNSPAGKDDDEDNDDDDDDDPEENDVDGKKSNLVSSEINPERLKAFNMFVRLFVDENLDRLVPISKQPKEKINAIIVSCQRQFPEFSERARKRIRTYLKSCRRSSRLKEPTKRAAENMSVVTSHIPSTQLAEVNNILSQACYNETQEVTKRGRYDIDDSLQSKINDKQPPSGLQNHLANAHVHDRPGQKYVPFSSASRNPPVKLSTNEIVAVRQLISGYRESAAFLYRSADELENLLRQSEQYYGQQNQQQQPQQQIS